MFYFDVPIYIIPESGVTAAVIHSLEATFKGIRTECNRLSGNGSYTSLFILIAKSNDHLLLMHFNAAEMSRERVNHRERK